MPARGKPSVPGQERNGTPGITACALTYDALETGLGAKGPSEAGAVLVTYGLRCGPMGPGPEDGDDRRGPGLDHLGLPNAPGDRVPLEPGRTTGNRLWNPQGGLGGNL